MRVWETTITKKVMTPFLRRLAALGSVFTFGVVANSGADTTYECSTDDLGCLDNVFVIELRDKNGKFSSLCTGVAIHPRILLTAAHCIEDNRDEGGSWVIYKGSTYDKPRARAYRKAVDSGIHPDYNPDETYYEYDIGYLVLNRPLPRKLHYPIIPSYVPQLRKNEKLLRVGYGQRRRRNRMARAWPKFERFLKDQGYPHVMRLKDDNSYGGDSGGPLFLDSPEGMLLLAVHSTVEAGQSSQASDRIYAPLVTPALDWITEETQSVAQKHR